MRTLLKQNYRPGMQKTILLCARPLKQEKGQAGPQDNLFQSSRDEATLPSVGKLRGRSFDFVGSREWKEKYVAPSAEKQASQQHSQSAAHSINIRQDPLNQPELMQEAINRSTAMSGMAKDQLNLATKEMRQLQRYKEFQEAWAMQSQKLRRLSLRGAGQKTLLEDNVKGIYVHENEDRADIINNHVVNVWEMSLRNNNKILQRHIKGTSYQGVELEKLMQTERGVKMVERSIPVLPVGRLRSTDRRDLSLRGKSQSQCSSGVHTARSSQSKVPGQEQVLKIDYAPHIRWLSTTFV